MVKTTDAERQAFREEKGFDGPRAKTVVKQRKIRPCISTQAVDNALSKIRAELCENPPDGLRMQILLLPEIYSRHIKGHGPMERGQWEGAISAAHETFWGFSSHSFRRSMCMHLFYEQGWPAPKVMGVSGHKSMDSFYKYVGYSSHVAQADYVALFE
jgi:integrase